MAELTEEELRRQNELNLQARRQGAPPPPTQVPITTAPPTLPDGVKEVPTTIRQAVTGQRAEDIIGWSKGLVDEFRAKVPKYADKSDVEIFDYFKEKYPEALGKKFLQAGFKGDPFIKRGVPDVADAILSNAARGAASFAYEGPKGLMDFARMTGDYIVNTPPWRMNPENTIAGNLETYGRHLAIKKPETLDRKDLFDSIVKISSFPGAGIPDLAQKVIMSQPEVIGKAMMETGRQIRELDKAKTFGLLPDKVPEWQQNVGNALMDAGELARDFVDQKQKANKWVAPPDPNDTLAKYSFGTGSGTAQVLTGILTARLPVMVFGIGGKLAKYLSAFNMAAIDTGSHWNEASIAYDKFLQGLDEKAAELGITRAEFQNEVLNGIAFDLNTTRQDARNFSMAYGLASFWVENKSLDFVLSDKRFGKATMTKLFGKGFVEKLAKISSKNPFMKKVYENEILNTMKHIVMAGQVEGAEEWTQSLAEHIIGSYGGYKDFKDFTEAAWDSYIIGSLSGMIGGGFSYIPITMKERAYYLNEKMKEVEEKMKEKGIKSSVVDGLRESVKTSANKSLQNMQIHETMVHLIEKAFQNPDLNEPGLEAKRVPKIIFSNQGSREYIPVEMQDKTFINQAVVDWNKANPDRAIQYDDIVTEDGSHTKGLTKVQKELIEGAIVAHGIQPYQDDAWLQAILGMVTGDRVVFTDFNDPSDPDLTVNYRGQTLPKKSFAAKLHALKIHPKNVRVFASLEKGQKYDVKEFTQSLMQLEDFAQIDIEREGGGAGGPDDEGKGEPTLPSFEAFTKVGGMLDPKKMREDYGDLFADGFTENPLQTYVELFRKVPQGNKIMEESGVYHTSDAMPLVIKAEIMRVALKEGSYSKLSDAEAVKVIQHLAADYFLRTTQAKERGDRNEWNKEKEKWVETEGKFNKDVYYRGLDPSTPEEKRTTGVGHYTTNPIEAQDFAEFEGDLKKERLNPVVKKSIIKPKNLLDVSSLQTPEGRQKLRDKLLKQKLDPVDIDKLIDVGSKLNYSVIHQPYYAFAQGLGFDAVKFTAPRPGAGPVTTLVPLRSNIVKPVKDYYLSDNDFYENRSKEGIHETKVFSNSILNLVRLKMNIYGRGKLRTVNIEKEGAKLDKIVVGSREYDDLIANVFEEITAAHKNGEVPIIFTEAVLTEGIDTGMAFYDTRYKMIVMSESAMKDSYQKIIVAGEKHPHFPQGIKMSYHEFKNFVLEHEKTHAVGRVDATDHDERIADIIALERIGRHQEAEQMRQQVEKEAKFKRTWDLADTQPSVPALKVIQDEQLWQPLGQTEVKIVDHDVATFDTGQGLIDVDQNGYISWAEPNLIEDVGKNIQEVQYPQMNPVSPQEKLKKQARMVRANQIFTTLFNMVKNLDPDRAQAVANVYEDYKKDRATDLDVLYIILNQVYDLQTTATLVNEIKHKLLQNTRLDSTIAQVQEAHEPIVIANEIEGGKNEIKMNRDVTLESRAEANIKWKAQYPNLAPRVVLGAYDKGDEKQKKKFEEELDKIDLSIEEIRDLAENPIDASANDDTVDDIFGKAQAQYDYSAKKEYGYSEGSIEDKQFEPLELEPETDNEDADDESGTSTPPVPKPVEPPSLESETQDDQDAYTEAVKQNADATTVPKEYEEDQVQNDNADDFYFSREGINSSQVSDALYFVGLQDRAVSLVDRIGAKASYLEFLGLLEKAVKGAPAPQVTIRIISGGQTGADRGALEGARELGLVTGGIAPAGWKTEGGSDPTLEGFGLKQSTSSNYQVRTEQNVVDSDGTVVFGDVESVGSRLTIQLANKHNKPLLINPTADQLRVFSKGKDSINIAGNRESKNPGLQKKVASIVKEAFKAGKTGTIENLSIEQISEVFKGELAELDGFTKRGAQKDDALYRLGVELWYGESSKKTTSADNLRARIKTLVDSIPSSQKSLKDAQDALKFIDKEAQEFFKDRLEKISRVKPRPKTPYARSVRDYKEWISRYAPASWKAFSANGYKNQVVDEYTKAAQQEKYWMGRVSNQKHAPSPELHKVGKMAHLAVAWWKITGMSPQAIAERVHTIAQKEIINAPEFAGIREKLRLDIGKSRGRMDFGTTLGYVTDAVIQSHALDYYKKKGVSDPQDSARKALAYLGFAAQEIMVHHNSGPGRYALSMTGRGGIHRSALEAKAFVNVYPEVYQFFTGNSLTAVQLNQINNERPSEAVWSIIPKEFKSLLIYVNSSIINPIKLLGERLGVFEAAILYNHQLIGWNPRSAFRRDQPPPGKGRSSLPGEDNPSRTHLTEEEYYFKSSEGQDTPSGAQFKVMDFPGAVNSYLRNTWDKIIIADTANKLTKMTNPTHPDLKMVEYEHNIKKLMDKGTIPKGVAEVFLEKSDYVQMKSMEGLANHWRGSFRVPWVHRSAVPLIERLLDVDPGSAGKTNSLLNASGAVNRLHKVTAITFPALFALQIYFGLLISNASIKEKIKHFTKVITSAIPVTGMSIGTVAGGAIMGGPVGAVVGGLLGFITGVGGSYAMPGVARSAADRLMGVARPWELYKDWDPGIVAYMYEHNVQMAVIGGAFKSVYDRMNLEGDATIPGLKTKMEKAREFLFSKFGMDTYIFEEVIPKMIYLFFKSEMDKGLKEGKTKDQAANIAGHVVNRTAGSLSAYAQAAPARKILRAVLFAVDFTIATVSTLYGASIGAKEYLLDFFEAMGVKEIPVLKRSKAGKVPTNLLGQIVEPFILGDLNAAQKKEVSKRMFGFVALSMFLAMFFSKFTQLALQNLGEAPGDDEDDEEQTFLQQLLNEPGRQFDIRMPWKSRHGNPVYTIMPMAKELKEIQQITGIGTSDVYNLDVFLQSLWRWIQGKFGAVPKAAALFLPKGKELPGTGRTLPEELTPQWIDITNRAPYDTQVFAPVTAGFQSIGLSPYEGVGRNEYYHRGKRMVRREEGQTEREARELRDIRNFQEYAGQISSERVQNAYDRKFNKVPYFLKKNEAAILEQEQREAANPPNLIERIVGHEVPWSRKRDDK